MPHYTVIYDQEIIADTPDDAARKAAQYLTEDLSQPYTELSLTVVLDPSSPELTKIRPAPSLKGITVGITKDSRGRRTFIVDPDSHMSDLK